MSQIVRWSMRPASGEGNMTLAADAHDGKLRVVVTALDQQSDFVNFLAMRGTVIDPQMQAMNLALEQVAPGRYVGELPADAPGSYFVTVAPGSGQALLRAGVDVAYSAEYRDLESNDALLARLAEQAPRRGTAGRMIRLPGPSLPPVEANVFRHDLPPAVTRQPSWHWMVLAAACLFFCDVFNRRVAIPWAAVGRAAAAPWSAARATLRGQRAAPRVESVVMDRLRRRKAEVGQELDVRREQTRFESPAESLEPLVEEPPRDAPGQSPQEVPTLAKAGEDDSYTARLLKAKRGVWKK
jgi:hypothetical protein